MSVTGGNLPPRWFLWSVLGVLLAILSFIFQFSISGMYAGQARQDETLVTQGQQIAAMQQELVAMEREGQFRQQEITALEQRMASIERDLSPTNRP